MSVSVLNRKATGLLLIAAQSVPGTAGAQDALEPDSLVTGYEIVDTQMSDAAARTASVGEGRVGQRQTRAQAAPNIAPLGRLSTRVQNRVQNRIRNRVDEHYDPRANATSPFEIAGQETRNAGRRATPQ